MTLYFQNNEIISALFYFYSLLLPSSNILLLCFTFMALMFIWLTLVHFNLNKMPSVFSRVLLVKDKCTYYFIYSFILFLKSIILWNWNWCIGYEYWKSIFQFFKTSLEINFNRNRRTIFIYSEILLMRLLSI